MEELIFNTLTGETETLVQVINGLYQQFSTLQNRPAPIADYDIWRQGVKEKYPRDYNHLLTVLSELYDGRFEIPEGERHDQNNHRASPIRIFADSKDQRGGKRRNAGESSR